MPGRKGKKRKHIPFNYVVCIILLTGILLYSFSYTVNFIKEEVNVKELTGTFPASQMNGSGFKKHTFSGRRPDSQHTFFSEKLKSLISKPEFAYPEVSQTTQLVKHSAFTLSYHEKYEQAEWVAYSLSRESLESPKAKRKNNFRPDPSVKTISAHPDDYKNSGYDRGHLAPAADFSWSVDALSESFYMSNISPQTPSFNRGIWKKLEDQVREWAVQNEKIYVVTGPVLEEGLQTIGGNAVAIPRYFYKIVLDIEEPEIKAIGFIMPNSPSDKTIKEFSVTIDSIEALTKLNFFPMLPDSLESQLERSINIGLWFNQN